MARTGYNMPDGCSGSDLPGGRSGYEIVRERHLARLEEEADHYEPDYGGAFDGNTVSSDADGGL